MSPVLVNPSQFATSGGTDAGYVAAVLADSPWAWWRGTTDITRLVDSGSLSEPWTISQVGFQAPPITAGGTYSMNPKTTGYIARRTLPSFLVGDVAQAFEFWVDIPTGNYSGVFMGVGSGLDGWEIGIGGSTFDNTGRQLIFVNPGVAWLPTGLSFPTGTSHVVGSRAVGGAWSIYMNAGTPYTTTFTHNPSNPSNIIIGGDADGVSRRFSSATLRLAEFAFYDTTLSSTRVAAHYNSGSGDRPAVTADSPAIWLKMDDLGPYSDPSGNYFLDSSGNARHTAVVDFAPTLVTGPVNKAFSFASGARGLSSVATQNQPTTVTYELWLYLTANPSATTTLLAVDGRAGDSGPSSAMRVNADGTVSLFTWATNEITITSPSALTTGAWHHIIGSVGADGMKVRIDKSTVATNARTAVDQLEFSRPTIIRDVGNLTGTTGKPALLVAEPAIWRSQLSDAQTDAHYDAAP